METVFLVSALVLLYILVGYPVLLFLVSRIRVRPVAKSPYTPTVTLIISVYNEQAIIEEKIQNTLALVYPSHLLSILVVSDGSTDRTDEIVKRYESQNVRLVRIDGRRGKTHCLNHAVAQINSEIVVFSDANSMYDPNAITELVANFSDPNVGIACGELRYRKRSGTEERLYWNIETFLKERESAVDSCLGVNGAIYAMRRTLFVPLADHVQSDFVEPFLVYSQGYRVVYDPSAFCIEEPATNHGEYDRKIRIVHGAFRSLNSISQFLNPLRYGWYSITLWSHKIIRWFMFVCLLGTLISSAFLASQPFYLGVFLIQVFVYVLAFFGRYVPGRIFSLPYYLVLINLASIAAVIYTLRGKPVETWEPVRPQ